MKKNYNAKKLNPDIQNESQGKHLLLTFFFILYAFLVQGQSTTVFVDNFDRGSTSTFPGNGGTPAMTWTSYSTLSPAGNIVTWGVTGSYAEDRVLQIFGTNTTANSGSFGKSYMTGPLSNFNSLFKPTLNQNVADVTWTFNWRNNRSGSSLTGFDAGNSNYGQAVVLAASGSDFLGTGTNGYAVTLTGLGSSTKNERIVKLVRFEDGLTANANITSLIASSTGTLISTNYSSIKVIYSPATNTWKFYVRDDASSTIAKDPTTENETLGYYTLVGSVVDDTYTTVAMSSCGLFYNHGITTANSSAKASYDNFGVAVAAVTTSDEARLSGLNVDKNGGTDYSGLIKFDPDVYSYQYYLTKYQNVIPTVSVVKMNDAAHPVITEATSLTGNQSERTTTITVTAEDGITVKNYTVEFVKTDEVFQDGILPTGGSTPPSGWKASSMFFSTVNDGNNKFQESGYARCGSTSTASSLILPIATSVGTLRFYARKIHTDVVGSIKVSTKTDTGNWIEVYDLGDISNSAYQMFEVPVNKVGVDSMFVKLDITKNGNTFASAGYYFDDFSYTEFTDPIIIANPTTLGAFGTVLGTEVSTTISVGGTNLTGNINITIGGENAAMFSTDTETISQTDGVAHYRDVVVSYLPTSTGSHTATLTIACSGVTDIVYELIGSTTTTSEIKLSDDITLSVFNNKLIINGADSKVLSVSSLTGQLIMNKILRSDNESFELQNGFYIICVANQRFKVQLNSL